MSGSRAPEPSIAQLERWEAHGATWRTVMLTDTLAVIEFCTCHGEPVDQIRSRDPELLRYVAARHGQVDPLV